MTPFKTSESGASVIPETSAVTTALDALADPESEEELATLQSALDAISKMPDATGCVPAMFRIFERFPGADGFETFWGILHALERMPGFESHLISSVKRAPGEFNLLMVNRLLNGGVRQVDGVPLLALLEEVARGTSVSAEARAEARRYLDWQISAKPG
jgi:hypothetical protein